MPDQKTIGIYDARANDYAAKNEAHNRSDPRLAAFIAACPPGGRVLDLGCGPGASAAVMARAGLRAVAMDASPAMVELAAARPGVEARLGSFAALSGAGIYDGIWANFSLLHAPRTGMPGHLAAIRTALKPRGAFYIALKLGKGEARDALGRFYTYYEEDELTNLLQDAGLTVLDRAHGDGEGLDGAAARWISVACHG